MCHHSCHPDCSLPDAIQLNEYGASTKPLTHGRVIGSSDGNADYVQPCRLGAIGGYPRTSDRARHQTTPGCPYGRTGCATGCCSCQSSDSEDTVCKRERLVSLRTNAPSGQPVWRQQSQLARAWDHQQYLNRYNTCRLTERTAESVHLLVYCTIVDDNVGGSN